MLLSQAILLSNRLMPSATNHVQNPQLSFKAWRLLTKQVMQSCRMCNSEPESSTLEKAMSVAVRRDLGVPCITKPKERL